jgi:hypothetical protein
VTQLAAVGGSGAQLQAGGENPAGLAGGDTAGAGGRGVLVSLGRILAVNLNAVAATNFFLTPASGFTRCIVDQVVIDNLSGTPTTNAISFGASGTPTDWLAAVVLAATLGAGKGGSLYPVANLGFAVYGTGVQFVANVTVGGAAITCDLRALGYYE